ncbi:MAG: hypothetical protein SF069_11650 [Phycisphaerae bacterium]|nr:hypothetical protein [Phycisphaerae bacterium]
MGFANYIYDGARRIQELLRFPNIAAVTALWAGVAGAKPPINTHAECGGGWNARWRAELHSLGKPLSKLTAEDLWPICDRIMRDFGL